MQKSLPLLPTIADSERIVRLEKNSSNSSKLPSSDITKPKEEQRQSGRREIGGQRGHEGSWRMLFLPEEVDETKELKVSRCPDYKVLLVQSEDIVIQQQAKLVKKPVIVTEYDLHKGHCLF